jgi:hypothetical protein
LFSSVLVTVVKGGRKSVWCINVNEFCNNRQLRQHTRKRLHYFISYTRKSSWYGVCYDGRYISVYRRLCHFLTHAKPWWAMPKLNKHFWERCTDIVLHIVHDTWMQWYPSTILIVTLNGSHSWGLKCFWTFSTYSQDLQLFEGTEAVRLLEVFSKQS